MDELDLGATVKGFSAGQTVFNRYTLKKILGRGGMGVVWLAQDEELERAVALKFLPELVAMDKEAVKDLKRETRRSLQLTHPHIVRIHDFINDARSAAISMEYVAGDTLASLKVDRPTGCFEVAEIREWTRQLCEALDYAHRRASVVHRDLKPANLMIDAEGYLKVADFGIAASTSDSVSRVSAQAGSSGTPLYMSPQQMLGERPAATDDIYALGATLFELLTGKPPFYAGNILLQVQSKAPPTLAERRRELAVTGAPIPAAWETTLAACLAKTPDARPQSAGEVWRRLDSAGAAPAVVGSETSAAAGSGAAMAGLGDKPVAPKKRRFVMLGLAVLALALGGVGYWQYSRSQSVEPTEEAPKVDAAALAQQKHAEALIAWPGQLKNDGEIYLTPLKYSLEAFSRIAEGVMAGAARRLAQGAPEPWQTGKGEPDQPKPADLQEFIRRASAVGKEVMATESPDGYLEAIGWWIAQNSFFPEIEFTAEEWPLFLHGLQLLLTGQALPHLGDEDQMHFDESIDKRLAEYAAKARVPRMARYYEELDARPDITRTASGLRYTVEREGKGDYPSDKAGIRCRFSIRATEEFFMGTESTTDEIDLRPGDVMPGMWEGLQHVRVGGKIRLYIPAALTQVGRLKKYPKRDGDNPATDMPHDMDLKVEAEVLAVLPP